MLFAGVIPGVRVRSGPTRLAGDPLPIGSPMTVKRGACVRCAWSMTVPYPEPLTVAALAHRPTRGRVDAATVSVTV